MVIIPFLPFSFCQPKGEYFVALVKWYNRHKLHPWLEIYHPRGIRLLLNCYIMPVGYTVWIWSSYYALCIFRTYFAYSCNYLHCVSIENFMQPMRLWKMFATFVNTALLNSGLNHIILRDLFCDFCRWIINQLWIHFSFHQSIFEFAFCCVECILTIIYIHINDHKETQKLSILKVKARGKKIWRLLST